MIYCGNNIYWSILYWIILYKYEVHKILFPLISLYEVFTDKIINHLCCRWAWTHRPDPRACKRLRFRGTA